MPFPKSPVAIIDKAAEPYHVTVKFVDSAGVRAAGGAVWSLTGASTTALQSFINSNQLTLMPEFRLPPAALLELQAEAEAASNRAQPDLGGVFRIGFATADPASQQLMATQLQNMAIVEYVQAVSSTPQPPADIPPTTPLYESQQQYFAQNPGFDFSYANGLGLLGQGMSYVDIEYCWVLDHEDIVNQLQPEPGVTPTYGNGNGWCFHGVAATGVISALPNAYGMKGAAPGAIAYVHPEHGYEPLGPPLQRRAQAIATGQQRSAPGDVLMLEMQQCFGTGSCGQFGRFGPAEIEFAVWMASRMASDAGRVVVAAAGNGNQNLDSSDPDIAAYRALGDSGAIIVGAGSGGLPSFPMAFTTYGSRVNLQGWGAGLATLGYGFPVPNAPDDERQTYTQWFTGTSSATPLVTASVLLTQQRAKAVFGEPMRALEIRNYLRATGNPQGSSPKQIGPQPNMRRAIDRLGEADVAVTPAATEYDAIVMMDNLGPSRARQLVVDVDIYSSTTISLTRVDSSPATCVARPAGPDISCAGQCTYLRCTFATLVAGYEALVWQCIGPPSGTGVTGRIEARIVSGTHSDLNPFNNVSSQNGPLCNGVVLK